MRLGLHLLVDGACILGATASVIAFSTDTSTGTITDADWGVVLMRAFGRSWSLPK